MGTITLFSPVVAMYEYDLSPSTARSAESCFGDAILYATYRIAGNVGGLPPNCVFADLNLAVWNSIAIHTCTRYNFGDFNLAVSPKTAKPPNLRY